MTDLNYRKMTNAELLNCADRSDALMAEICRRFELQAQKLEDVLSRYHDDRK